jgi:holliday junction DNA helicase RuvA
MIGSLRGKLVERRPNQVTVDVAGVGYLVQIPLSTFSGMPSLDSDVKLLIHTHLREDQIALYGFATAREKQVFEMLISVSGIGPNLAVKILSGMALDELLPALREGDVARLVQIPGIGRKTAERMIVELREKAAMLQPGAVAKVGTRSAAETDVASALSNLGYDSRVIDRTLEQLRKGTNGHAEFNDLLRAALQQLGAAAMQKSARAGE